MLSHGDYTSEGVEHGDEIPLECTGHHQKIIRRQSWVEGVIKDPLVAQPTGLVNQPNRMNRHPPPPSPARFR